MPAGKRFGELLTAARRQSGLTQQELADRVGDAAGVTLTQQHISNWSRGRHLPADRHLLMALCQGLFRSHGLKDLDEINALLLAADEGALQRVELTVWLPELLNGAEEAEHHRPPSSQPQADEEGPAGRQPAVDHAAGREATEARRARLGAGGGTRGGRRIDTGNPHEPRPWYTRVVESVALLQELLTPPEHHGMVAAIALSTVLVASAWQSPATPGSDLARIILFAGSLWASTLVLTLPPSAAERGALGRAWWRRKLYRLSGVASGVFILAGLLLWIEALSQLLMATPLPPGTSFLIVLLGAIFAYAGGAQVQQSFIRGEAGESFYLSAAVQVGGMMMLAQALLAGFLAMIGARWSSTIFLLVLVPAAWMLWHSLRRS